METQLKLLESHLKKGLAITQPEAMQKYGIGRLASRIWDLKDDGLNITSSFIPYKRKTDGKLVQIKSYKLA